MRSLYLSIDWVREFFSQASVFEIIGVCVAVLIGLVMFMFLARWVFEGCVERDDDSLFSNFLIFAIASSTAGVFHEFIGYNLQTNFGFLFWLGVFAVIERI